MAQKRDEPGSSRHLSLRLRAELLDRLTRRAQGNGGESRSRLAARLIDEGLRMDAHAGIVFRSGPGGRRAGLASGPDVWEVARVLRDVEATGEDALATAAKLTGLELHQVRTAAAYYRDFQGDVDAWLQALDREAEDAAPTSRMA